MKKITYILAGVGLLLLLTLAFYLGVKSEKIFESIGAGGGLVGVLAALFYRNRTSSGNNRGRSSEEPGISIDELGGIRKRYRDVDRRLESGLTGAKSEAGHLRDGLKRDRERIRGLEGSAVRVRDAANKLDKLIARIQEEGID